MYAIYFCSSEKILKCISKILVTDEFKKAQVPRLSKLNRKSRHGPPLISHTFVHCVSPQLSARSCYAGSVLTNTNAISIAFGRLRRCRTSRIDKSFVRSESARTRRLPSTLAAVRCRQLTIQSSALELLARMRIHKYVYEITSLACITKRL